MKKVDFFKLGFIVILLVAIVFVYRKNQDYAKGGSIKLYWLVAEGMLADPDVFSMVKWAEEGELPQIKKMMADGVFAYAQAAGSPQLPEFIKNPETQPKKLALISVSERIAGDLKPDFMITSTWGLEESGRPDTFTYESGQGAWETQSFSFPVKTFSDRKDIRLEAEGIRLFASSVDLSNDQTVNYDSLSFSRDGKKIDATLKSGEMSVWFPIAYTLKGKRVDSQLRYQLIDVNSEGDFKVRVHLDGLNEVSVLPPTWEKEIRKNVGPMVDATDESDSFSTEEEKERTALIKEMKSSLDWHEAFIPYLAKVIAPEFVVHKLFHPRQLFTSNWWLGGLHPQSKLYASVAEDERAKRKSDVLALYKRVDQLLGRILISSAKDAVIVLSASTAPRVVNQKFFLQSYITQKGWDSVQFSLTEGITFTEEASDSVKSRVKKELETLKDENGQLVFASVESELEEEKLVRLRLNVSPGMLLSEGSPQAESLFEPVSYAGSSDHSNVSQAHRPSVPFLIVGPGLKKGVRMDQKLQFSDQEAIVRRALGDSVGDKFAEVFVTSPTSSGKK